MDIKEFYKKVDAFLKHAESSLFDKLKLDNSDLVNAVKNNNPAEVAKALNAWVNPNKEDGLGRIPLPNAVENNSILIVGMLLRKKADPNVLGKDGQSPLFKAVFWENEELVQILLHAGAKVDFENSNGKTALEEAEANSYKRIIAFLKGDKVSKRKEQVAKDTAIHEKMKQKAQIVKNEKEANQKAEREKTNQILAKSIQEKYLKDDASIDLALNAAIKAKDSEAVKYFVDRIDNLNDLAFQNNPLALAISLNQTKLADYLIESGADIFYKEENESEYLIFIDAIRRQHHGLIEKALQKNANSKELLNDKSQSLSAQFLAYKDPKMFDILLQAGADPYFGGIEGICPIKKAIEKGSIAILPVLAKNKVDLTIETEGKTLLNWATNNKRKDWVNGLITEGVLSNMDQNSMQTLINEAESVEDQEADIIEMLKNSLDKV